MSKRAFKVLAVLTFVLLAFVGTVTFFGDNLRRLFGSGTVCLAGDVDPHPAAMALAANTPRPAPADSLQRKSLRNFGAYDEPEAAPPPPPAGRTTSNPYTLTSDDTLSTFAVDVDTASYAQFRRSVKSDRIPADATVRVEEWVNYFRYRVPEPTPAEGPFHVALEAAPSPFSPRQHLLKVSLQGRHLTQAQRKPTHLVFLVDISGSMSGDDRLGLAKKSMKLAVAGLNPTDTVALTTYAGDVRTVLESTPVSQRKDIDAAIDALATGGGTNMGDGLELAYQHAVHKAGSKNVARVVVLTDGDTNLGRDQSADAMLARIGKYVKEGVTLSTIGFGMGNYRDDLMERLANRGNGNCYYIDSEREARRVFQEQLGGTMEVIAQDVKIQVEFDKVAVKGYRLLGYENRAIADKDFRKDSVDAGEVGSGHTVTALYELDLTGEGSRVATVRVRAKKPGGSEAAEQPFHLERSQVRDSLSSASADLRFAIAVAGTADLLRGTTPNDDRSFARLHALAADAVDGQEDREEFLTLLGKLRELLAPRGAVQSAQRPPY
ncbi:von Willebrand factor type A domain-containing protein [Myxococcus stipitatus DSM 14675]|uniref:von Willebrand factor type A domain-containing protein n=1 Tax=Myxococcus stipitatus (strain DSM 14675 / JCM 12634 / Mx s8) TaxID=1278073 RepID=L7UH12_MYXSD|nr:von Willebrand factor type A domain-containing protein [Myxococcus stipitatus]AGC48271.1 von Willebrand factor type A domain-containing protein [Myxococcus stipitatus DSM 14675]